MAERPEDLNLPVAVINRLVKETLPEGVNVSKEARAAISKAASVFVLFATSCANNFALKAKRKTLTGQDVMAAMTDMDFDKFVVPLQESLETYRQGQKGRKDALERRKQKDASGTELETLEAEDVEEEGLEGGEEEEEEGDGDNDNDVSNRSAANSDSEDADEDNMDADHDASK